MNITAHVLRPRMSNETRDWLDGFRWIPRRKLSTRLDQKMSKNAYEKLPNQQESSARQSESVESLDIEPETQNLIANDHVAVNRLTVNVDDVDDDLDSIHSDSFLDSPTLPTAPIVPAAASTPQKKKIFIGSSMDGVFANISAKPETQRADETKVDVDDLPGYSSVEADVVPPYPQVAVLLNGQAIEDLVGERHVGSLMTFIAAIIVSFSFQFLGLFVCMIFCQSHAGRMGARAGFGMALVHFGIVLRNRSMGFVYDADGYLTGTNSGESDDGGVFMSYVLLVVGWFLSFQAIGDYFRIRRMHQLMNTQPAISQV